MTPLAIRGLVGKGPLGGGLGGGITEFRNTLNEIGAGVAVGVSCDIFRGMGRVAFEPECKRLGVSVLSLFSIGAGPFCSGTCDEYCGCCRYGVSIRLPDRSLCAALRSQSDSDSNSLSTPLDKLPFLMVAVSVVGSSCSDAENSSGRMSSGASGNDGVS